MTRPRRLILTALAVAVTAPATATLTDTASAAPDVVRECPSSFSVDARLGGVATITSVRNMTCRSALTVVRRNGRRAGKGAYREGGKFRLGQWRCITYLHRYELYLARCTRGSKAFRIDYGS